MWQQDTAGSISKDDADWPKLTHQAVKEAK